MAIIDIRMQMGTGHIWGGQTSREDLLETLTRYGIGGCVVSSTIGNACDFRSGNLRVKQDIEQQSRLLGCLVVNTAHTEDSIKDMHEYLPAKNFAGMIITSGIPGRHVTYDECADILNAFRRFNKTVFLEAGNREAVAAAREIAEQLKTIRFCLLSMGGDDWLNAAAAAAKVTNLYLETSGNLNPNKIKLTYEMIGPNRLLFGSNWPYADPALTIGLVEDADISDADKKRIFETNALRLLGFGRKEE